MKHIETFAEDMEKNLEEKEVPVWDGELYFEYHRGTYTSQAFIKRENRKAEVLYHDIELFSSVRDILEGVHSYPAKELEDNWKKICTNQFHDIIPGSSIREVYMDAAKSYQEIRRDGSRLLNLALEGIAGSVKLSGDGITVFNPLPWERTGMIRIAEVPENQVLTDGEREIPVQYSMEEGRLSGEYLVGQIPSCGYRSFQWVLGDTRQAQDAFQWDKTLETAYYSIEFNQFGQIIRIYDKEYDREVLTDGGLGNELCVFEDKPHQFEAWNTEIYAYQKHKSITDLKEMKMTENGPLKTVLELTYGFGKSVIRQQLTVYRHSREIRFDTWCDWQERHSLLKAAFDVDIRATQAVYDIQFGNLTRSTHSNTSWDYAQFEVCAQKWADLSEGNYGVTLMNDCKYGYDIKDRKMRLTLIKTSSYPDRDADLGEHIFSYALLPHGGSWKEAQSHRSAYEFNFPMYAGTVKGSQGHLPESFSFVSTPSSSVVTETVKKAEDEDAWIIRAYECMQHRGKVTFQFGRALASVSECNPMEEETGTVRTEGSRFTCEMAPYEIKTFKVVFS